MAFAHRDPSAPSADMPRAMPRAAVALLACLAYSASAFQLPGARNVLATPVAARAVGPVALFGKSSAKPKGRVAKVKKAPPKKKVVKKVAPKKKPVAKKKPVKRVAPKKKVVKRVAPKRGGQVAKSEGLPVAVQAGLPVALILAAVLAGGKPTGVAPPPKPAAVAPKAAAKPKAAAPAAPAPAAPEPPAPAPAPPADAAPAPAPAAAPAAPAAPAAAAPAAPAPPAPPAIKKPKKAGPRKPYVGEYDDKKFLKVYSANQVRLCECGWCEELHHMLVCS